ncbi:MAG: family transcriptional regulator, anaerobic regulatory protein [Hydrocarboniphaga sp.]|uniref:Crp/Fnr family transcriptional regulator n=1 Tax=Hydrocarboniphaga sp. TaxID=2033016 RepID=UPI002618CA9D|nr:Crp/Fnr family transcriptional regulator [Hydrocarboniphaga sp.]MDB5971345.1 family transcriptional regulator, anaerobic regulatory protein [Hydrocarboniphaga sp.]
MSFPPSSSQPASPCTDCSRRDKCLGAALNAVPGSSGGVTRSAVDRGAHLWRVGDTVDSIYVIRGGASKTYVVSEAGNEEIRGFQLANDVAGLDALCGSTHRTNARAISRTWVCRLPIAAVRARMSESAEFRDGLLSKLGREFDRLHDMLHRERCTADQRVAAFLVRQIENENPPETGTVDLELPMTRTDLARYLDLANETVSRVFTRFQNLNIMRSTGARCEILDRSALGALC